MRARACAPPHTSAPTTPLQLDAEPAARDPRAPHPQRGGGQDAEGARVCLEAALVRAMGIHETVGMQA